MFVVAVDFDTPPFNLPNLDKVVNTFPDFVTEQEDEELSKLFGNLFYDAFKAGIAALPAPWVQKISPAGYATNDLVVSGSDIYKSLSDDNVALVTDNVNWELQTANRWLKLKEGEDYSYQNYPYKWIGMKQLVKPLIYSLWVRTQVKQFTSNGVVVSSNENSDAVSPGDHIVMGWNRYCLIAVGKLSANCYVNIANSLIGYLYANSELFDDLVEDTAFSNFKSYLSGEFCSPGRQNVFDL